MELPCGNKRFGHLSAQQGSFCLYVWLMSYLKNKGRKVGQTSEVKIPNRNFWCENTCLQMVLDTDFTRKIYWVSLISYFQNIVL